MKAIRAFFGADIPLVVGGLVTILVTVAATAAFADMRSDFQLSIPGFALNATDMEIDEGYFPLIKSERAMLMIDPASQPELYARLRAGRGRKLVLIFRWEEEK